MTATRATGTIFLLMARSAARYFVEKHPAARYVHKPFRFQAFFRYWCSGKVHSSACNLVPRLARGPVASEKVRTMDTKAKNTKRVTAGLAAVALLSVVSTQAAAAQYDYARVVSSEPILRYVPE